MKNTKQQANAELSLSFKDLEQEIRRIKEEYSRQFGDKFEIPHPIEGKDEEGYRKRIEEIKSSFIKKLPSL